MGLVVFRVFEQHLIHIRTGILVELVATAKDDEGNLAIAKNRQLVSLLHYTELPLVESHLPISFIRDPGYLYFFATHGSNFGLV